MVRNVFGSLMALIGAAAVVWSPFRAWYDGRHGRDVRVDDLFGGLDGGRGVEVGLLRSLFLPMACAALIVLVGLLLRSRPLVALGGLVALGFTVLWMGSPGPGRRQPDGGRRGQRLGPRRRGRARWLDPAADRGGPDERAPRAPGPTHADRRAGGGDRRRVRSASGARRPGWVRRPATGQRPGRLRNRCRYGLRRRTRQARRAAARPRAGRRATVARGLRGRVVPARPARSGGLPTGPVRVAAPARTARAGAARARTAGARGARPPYATRTGAGASASSAPTPRVTWPAAPEAEHEDKTIEIPPVTDDTPGPDQSPAGQRSPGRPRPEPRGRPGTH